MEEVQIARLGLDINADSADPAKNKLDALSASAAKTEQAFKSVEGSTKSTTGSLAGLAQPADKAADANLRLAESWLKQAASSGLSRAEMVRLEAQMRGMTGAAAEAAEMAAKIHEQSAAAQEQADSITALGGVITKVATAAVAAMSAIYGMSVKAAMEAEQATLKVEGMIAATGGAAGRSVADVERMADSLAKLTRFDDESIKNAAAALMSFKNVAGATFDKTLDLAADLASLMGTDVVSAAQMLSSALDDPTMGMTMLRRAGIALTESQRDEIKMMMELGDVMGAQALLIEVIEGKVGGLAEKMNSGLSKATSDVAKAFNELAEAMGKSDAIGGTYKATLEGLTTAMTRLKWLVENEKLWLLLTGQVGVGMAIGLSERGLRASAGGPQVSPGEADAAASADQLADAQRKANAELDREKDIVNQNQKAFAKYEEQVRSAGERLKSTIAAVREAGRLGVVDASEVERVVRAFEAQAESKQKVAKADDAIAAAAEKARSAEIAWLSKLEDLQDAALGFSRAFHDQLFAINEAEKAGILTADEAAKARADNYAKNTKDGREAAKAIDDQTKAEEALTKALLARGAAAEREYETAKKRADDMERENQILMLGEALVNKMTIAKMREQVATDALNGATEEEIIYRSKAIDEYERYLAAVGNNEEIKKSQEEFKAFWTDLEGAAHNAFMDIAENGTDAFKRIGEALKTWLIDLLYQMTIKKFIVNVAVNASGGMGAGALNGLFGMTGGGGAGGGGMGGIGDISSLLSGGSSLFGGGGLSAGLATTFGNVALDLGLSSMAGSFAAFGSMLGMALPYIGAALAIATALGLFEKDPSEVQGKFGVRATGGSQFEDNASITTKYFGNIGFLDDGTKYFSGEAAQVFNKFIGDTLDAIGSRMTEAQRAATATRLQATEFAGLEGTYTTQDFLEKYGKEILHQVIVIAFEELNPAFAEIIRNFEGTADEITTLANGLLALGDIASKLPESLVATLASALDGTEETANRVLTFALAYASLTEVFNADPMADALEAVEIASGGVLASLDELGDGLTELASAYTGTAEESVALVEATVNYYNALVTALAQMEQLQKDITNSFQSMIRGWKLDTMDDDEKYDFYRKEAADLYSQLSTATTPEEVARLTSEIQRNMQDAWALLTPEERERMLAEFTANAERVNAAANQRIEELQRAAEERANAVLLTISQAMDRVAQKFDGAATKMDGAGDKLMRAANTPLVVQVVEKETDVSP